MKSVSEGQERRTIPRFLKRRVELVEILDLRAVLIDAISDWWEEAGGEGGVG